MRLPALILAMCLGIAVAEGTGGRALNSTVERLMIDIEYPNYVFVKVSGHVDERPNCHSSSGWDYVVNLNVPEEKNMYAMLLTMRSTAMKGDFKGQGPTKCMQGHEKLRRIEIIK